MTTIRDITNRIEAFAPKHLAEDWDPIGLSFGSYDKQVKKVMVALDLDKKTLKEAQDKEVDFIFTHHPTIFKSINTLNEHDSRRKDYIDLIRSDIALYSAHTNLDSTLGGMNDWLAEAIGLEGPYQVLDSSYHSVLKLLVLYTPLDDAKRMREVLHQVGAGQVGDYRNVSYTLNGIGHFTPENKANPTIGEQNRAEEVEEERLEVLFPADLQSNLIRAIYQNHPYEEPVFHILDIDKKDKEFGIGRIGNLPESQMLAEIITKVKNVFNLSHVRIGNTEVDQMIQRVAIVGGSGEGYYKQALNKQADLYITGDISYHGAQDMIRDGLSFIDAGHFIENIFTEKMTAILKKWNEEECWNIEVIPASSQEDVFKII